MRARITNSESCFLPNIQKSWNSICSSEQVVTYYDRCATRCIGTLLMLPQFQLLATTTCNHRENSENAVDEIEHCRANWRPKLNETKSVPIDFINSPIEPQIVYINDQNVLFFNSAVNHISKKNKNHQNEVLKDVLVIRKILDPVGV